MATDTNARAELRRLIDELNDQNTYAVLAYVRFVHEAQARPGIRMGLTWSDETAPVPPDDPVLRALETAPDDDEPVTPEQEAVLNLRRRSAARGETIADEDLARTLGL